MINIELGETYGLGSFEEAVAAIEMLRKRNFSDEEINSILERSKGIDFAESVFIPEISPLRCSQCLFFFTDGIFKVQHCGAADFLTVLYNPLTGRGTVDHCPLVLEKAKRQREGTKHG